MSCLRAPYASLVGLEVLVRSIAAGIDTALSGLRELLQGLPLEALDWRPWDGANSLSVLVLHSVSSTRFWLKAAAGDAPSLAAYREGPRADAFAARGLSVDQLVTSLDELRRELPALVARLSEDSLAAMLRWPEDPSLSLTGADALVRAYGHLREHLGQAELTRDAWRRGGRK